MSKLVPEKTQKPSDTLIRMRGAVTQVLHGSLLRVALPNGSEILAHISGHIRKKFIRIHEGDVVGLEMSPYNLNRARITLLPQIPNTGAFSGALAPASKLYAK